MRLTSLDELQPGYPLGQTIYNQRGDALLAAGTVLTTEYVRLLHKRGYATVLVEDEDSAGIVAEELISEETRARASGVTASSLVAAEHLARQFSDRTCESTDDEHLVEELRAGEHRREIEKSVPGLEIVTVAEDLVDELLDGPASIGLTSVKGTESFLMGHLVDVAAVAVQLGRKAALRGEDLRRLARGALVHDVGQVFGGDNVDGKTGALSSADVASLRRHTVVGYEFLRNVAAFDPLSNHVAYQHHERQDGLGYPRGLHGTNEVTRELNGNQGRILLLAEITAVADVYDALTSDRPDRPALPREFAFSLMTRMAGTQLNREIVELFLHSVPLFPAGYPVRFSSGRLAGCRGIVARAESDATRPPIVRLLTDQRARRIRPVEVDTSRYPGSRLVSDLPERTRVFAGDR